MIIKRLGLTVIEVVVVVGIVGALLGLTLVAVNRARESARGVACQNNLHQLGVAVIRYADAQGEYPGLLANRGAKGSDAFYQTAFIAILPELETPLPKPDPYAPSDAPAKYPPPVLRCPSGNEFLGYRYNAGSDVNWRTGLNGILRIFGGLRPSGVEDGLSNTALLSERMSGKDMRRPVAMASLPSYSNETTFVSDCVQLTNPTSVMGDIGLEWQEYQSRDIAYGHYSPPNRSCWDCQARVLHLICARSYHRGGVFTAYADGSVHWIHDTIDGLIWRGLGTVSGHDVQSALP